MTQPGETTNFTASDHVKALLEHIECDSLLDMIIVNEAPIPSNVLRRYAEKGAVPVECDLEALQTFAPLVIHDKFVKFDEPFIRHDAKKISRVARKYDEKKKNMGKGGGLGCHFASETKKELTILEVDDCCAKSDSLL